MKKPLMPPPPALIQPGQAREVTKYIQIRDHSKDMDIRKLEKHLRNARMQHAIHDLKANIAITEMKQERYRLKKESSHIKEKAQVIMPKEEAVYIKDEIAKLRTLVESTKSVTSSSKEELFIASLDGKRVHKVDCSFVKRMPKENRVSFDKLSEATEHGYEPCRKCCTVSDDTLVATKNGKTVHFASCPAAHGIRADNKSSFSSVKEAFSLGYSPCRMCMRHEDTVKQTTKTQTTTSKNKQSLDARRTTIAN